MSIRRNRIVNILLMIAAFLITISYASLTNNYETWNKVKFIGFIIILTIILLGSFSENRLNKKQLVSICYFAFFTIMSITTQNLSFSNSVLAVFYTVVLLLFVFRGYSVFKNSNSYFYAAFGSALGIIIVLAMSRTVITRQLAYAINGRIRIYGLFSHPNIFASILFSFVLLLDIGIRQNNLRKRKQIVCYLLIMIALILIYLTNSRTTLILAVTYFGIVYFNIIKNRFNKLNQMFFVVFTATIVLAIAYMFFNEYVLQQETFYMRISGYQNLSLSGSEWIFGHSFTGSSESGSFEFSIYTILSRIGFAGLIGYCALLYRFIRQAFENKRGYIGLALSITLAVSALAEAYIINITNLFSCIMYLLISSEVVAPGRRKNNATSQR